MQDTFCVITFPSVHQALKFEKTVKGKINVIKLIPVPRKISSSCGIAGRMEEGDLEIAKKICSLNGIEYEGIYRLYKDRKRAPEKIC
jgi:hypothetical protein